MYKVCVYIYTCMYRYACIQACTYIYIYTYKTTLRVIRRLWGVVGSTFRNIGPQNKIIELTALSNRICIGISLPIDVFQYIPIRPPCG